MCGKVMDKEIQPRTVGPIGPVLVLRPVSDAEHGLESGGHVRPPSGRPRHRDGRGGHGQSYEGRDVFERVVARVGAEQHPQAQAR